MVLEILLRRSRELTRYLRQLLGLELDGFCQWLHEQGCSRSVIRSHISNISQFNQYLRYLAQADGNCQKHIGQFFGLFHSCSEPYNRKCANKT